MKKPQRFLLASLVLLLWPGLGLAADLKNLPVANAKVTFSRKLKSFAAEKEEQVKKLAKKTGTEVPPEVAGAFAAAKRGDWSAASDSFAELQGRFDQPGASESDDIFRATLWATTLEMRLALELFNQIEAKQALAFADSIIQSIPRGSIYFGGTNPGHGLVTALCASHDKADPFFTLTQNHFTNERYLTYLRAMYGSKIYIPTRPDLEAAFQQYSEDVRRRREHDRNFPQEPRQLKPGEDIPTDEERGPSSIVGIMAINGLLTKLLFQRNPDREFYLEENFPLEWMFPHLAPHGPILQIHHKAPATLSPKTVSQDRKFWSRQQRGLIGEWLRPETPVEDVCLFAEKVFAKKDLSDFSGDPKFVKNEPACRMYSKLRSSIGGVYFWRASSASTPEEKERMQQEADFAFRQAFAFCPYSIEAVFRYINVLIGQKRIPDALRIAQTAAQVDPANPQLPSLIEQLQRLQEPPTR